MDTSSLSEKTSSNIDDTLKKHEEIIKKIEYLNIGKKYSAKYLIAIITFLIFYMLGLYKLLTTNNYKNLYDNELNKYLIILNVIYSIIIIGFIFVFIYYYYNEIVIKIRTDNMFKYGAVILAFIYLFYIFCTFKFILNLYNIEKNNDLEFDFFVHYYIFMEFIPFILFFVYSIYYLIYMVRLSLFMRRLNYDNLRVNLTILASLWM